MTVFMVSGAIDAPGYACEEYELLYGPLRKRHPTLPVCLSKTWLKESGLPTYVCADKDYKGFLLSGYEPLSGNLCYNSGYFFYIRLFKLSINGQ